jgi:hypothetical protein
MDEQRRNDICKCGSKLKYKYCCGRFSVDQNQVEILRINNIQKSLDSIKEIRTLKNSPEHPILKDFQIGIPYEDITDHKVLEVQRIAALITGNVKHVNAGGCGLFACLLQEVIGGDIYEISLLINLDVQFTFNCSHLFLLYDGYCYDAEGVCQESTLLSVKQPLRRANSLGEIRSTKPVETYCMFKRTKIEIDKEYKVGKFMNIYFSEDDASELKRNAQNLKNWLAHNSVQNSHSK